MQSHNHFKTYKIFSLPLRVFVALSLPFAEQRIEVQGKRRKEKSDGARKPTIPSDEPEQSSDNHYGEAVRKGSGTSPLLRCPQTGDCPAKPLGNCLFARKTAKPFFRRICARLRFSTAATRPSPLHPPPAARRRAPPRE